jgi:hypothetical protein
VLSYTIRRQLSVIQSGCPGRTTRRSLPLRPTPKKPNSKNWIVIEKTSARISTRLCPKDTELRTQCVLRTQSAELCEDQEASQGRPHTTPTRQRRRPRGLARSRGGSRPTRPQPVIRVAPIPSLCSRTPALNIIPNPFYLQEAPLVQTTQLSEELIKSCT